MLAAEDFATFYREVHGHDPFPWQRELPRQIVDHGAWPSMIDIPTGLGKTSLIDVAVFLAALDADGPVRRRLGRRRIFFVVDRRLVVDQAARHASAITDALADAPAGSVRAEVARRISSFTRHGPGYQRVPVVKMRGGTSWDSSWLDRPDLPGIVTGTVDQVGSRLLFRGYGVSSRRWSIDAALVGTDSLILIDEAHLAAALSTTLDSAASHDRPTHELDTPRPVMVRLSATMSSDLRGWVPQFDEGAHLADPVSAQRISARKLLTLRECPSAAAARTLGEVASAEAALPGGRVLVVCNTIDRARDVHARLVKSLPPTTPVLLLIGRTRPYEREEIVRQMLSLFEAGGERSVDPAVLVATQTVEVGIDLDATCLVSEVASWDALVQRMGRVNRRGSGSGKVVIVVDDDPAPPVYGSASVATAEYLRELSRHTPAGVDVSPIALRRLAPPQSAWSDRAHAPDLLVPHLDAWTRTSPPPVNDAPLDPYLHGIDRGVAPVSVAWRDGLLFSDGSRIAERPSHLTSLIDALPIRGEETVDVPLTAFRRWLAGDRPIPVSDWDEDEGDDWAKFDDESSAQAIRRGTQPDGSTAWCWASASEIRPGDTVVVPSERGGLDEYGWAPSWKNKVLDVAELAALDRGRPLLRLDRGLPDRLGIEPPPPEVWDQVRAWQRADDPASRQELSRQCISSVLSWLAASSPGTASPWDRASALRHDTRRTQLIQAMTGAQLEEPATGGRSGLGEDGVLPVAIMSPPHDSASPWRDATDERSDGTAHILRQVGLTQHGAAVSERAAEIAMHLGLTESITQAVTDAARWHDLGKVDPRFQAMLFDGDPVRAALTDEPLAKSGMPPGDLRRHREARRRSNLPVGARHEAWSHSLTAAHLESQESYGPDPDLVLHLVASHHGYARPLLPAIEDNGVHTLQTQIDGVDVVAELPKHVDLNHAQRFEALNKKYGRWGLALLEAIVRCADMTVSGEGS